MNPKVLLLASLTLLCLSGTGKATVTVKLDSDAVVDITDETFDELIDKYPVWMIEVFAPWCSHCRQLEQTWKQLSKELAPLGIRTGKIDGPKHKILMTRFGINSFPAIFLLRNGQAWEYTGARTTQALKDFATSGFDKATALPFWKAPNSFVGKALGHWHKIPALVKEAYVFLREDKGFSDLTIVGFVLAVPVFVGAMSICLIDGMCLRQARIAVDGGGHEHAD